MAFRDGPFENIKVPAVWTAAVAVVVAGIVALVLLLGDAGSRGAANTPARGAADSVAGPVNGAAAAPVRWVGNVGDYIGGYFFAVSENRRLKRELAEAQVWRDQAIALKNINGRYETLLGLTPDPPVAMQTARAITDVRGPFSRARLLDAGSARGIRIGNPVIGEHGLVGRIVGAAPAYSRMLLLTDVASRTPVMIERSDARAILTGDGSDNPRLEYVRGVGSVQEGDRVLSSGDGGGVPRGLPVGVAAKGLDGRWRVKLFSDRGPMDYVRVLLFQDFNQLIDPRGLAAAPLSGLANAPPPTADQTAAIGDASARRDAARQSAARQAAAPPPVAAAPTPAGGAQ